MSVSSGTIGGGRTKYKIIFLGDQLVGKSSIIEKYIRDRFEEGLNVHISHYAAHSRHRLPHQKRSQEQQAVQNTALGHCGPVAIQEFDPQLHEGCQLRHPRL